MAWIYLNYFYNLNFFISLYLCNRHCCVSSTFTSPYLILQNPLWFGTKKLFSLWTAVCTMRFIYLGLSDTVLRVLRDTITLSLFLSGRKHHHYVTILVSQIFARPASVDTTAHSVHVSRLKSRCVDLVFLLFALLQNNIVKGS